MGDQWFSEEKFRRNFIVNQLDARPIILPQTIFYTDTEEGKIKQEESIAIYNDPRVTLVAREQCSYKIMRRLYPKATVLLTPDIVLSANMETFGAIEQERKGVLFCLRSDAEKLVCDEVWKQLELSLDKAGVAHSRTDMCIDVMVDKGSRGVHVRNKMQEFCGAELVVTDRLHGMIFAAITGTPCVVFSNYNHKVKGTYDWISYLTYIRYVENVNEAISAMFDLLPMGNQEFNNEPLLPYFSELANLVKKRCRR
jgi:pyruvyl transferase EpsI